MLRRFSWSLILLILCSCTLMPDATPVPIQPCPTCQPCQVCPTLAPTPVPPTATLIPTDTPTSIPTAIPTDTPTPVPTLPPPTETPTPASPVDVMPTSTPVISLGPDSGAGDAAVSYAAQPNTPRLTQNFAHPGEGCAWLGIAGQVFDQQNLPVNNLVLLVTGDLNGQPVDAVGLTGSALVYGQGGYEIVLGQQPVASTGTLFLQVFDLAGLPISFPVAFDTSVDCDKNLVLVNFVRTP